MVLGPQPGAELPLLGRANERQALEDFVATVHDGLSGSLILVGEAGVGKTRLLTYAIEVAREARERGDVQVSLVAGVESEAQLGFAGLYRLLLPYLDRVDLLPGPQRDALASAFGMTSGTPANRFLVGLGCLTLLAGVASSGPLICIVDDVQWLDRESTEVLVFVGRRLHAEGVGLLLGLRQAGVARAGEIAAFAGLRVLHINGLDEANAMSLLTAAFAEPLDERVARNVVKETGGNPLALIELTTVLTADQLTGRAALPVETPLPTGSRLEAHFLSQTQTLPSATQQLLLLTTVAPADDPAVLWRAAQALGLSPEDADCAVSERVLVLDGGNARFRHPLIRSAIYNGASSAERRRVHEILAAATDPQRTPERRAWHLASASIGPDEVVARELEQAAERARGRGGYAAQALFLVRAAELTPDTGQRANRLLAAAEAYLIGGDLSAAQEMLDQAEPTVVEVMVRARAEWLRASIAMAFSRVPHVSSILLQAASEIRSLDVSWARRMLFEALGAGLLARKAMIGTTIVEVAQAVLDTPVDSSEPMTIPDLLLDAVATRIAVGHSKSVPLLRKALHALLTQQENIQVSTTFVTEAFMVADELWDDRARVAVLDRLEPFQRENGALSALTITLLGRAAHEWRSGHFGPAETLYAEASEMITAIGRPNPGSAQRVELLAWQGKQDEARAAARIAIDLWGGQMSVDVMSDTAHLALTVLELGLGQYVEALAAARVVYDSDAPGFGSRVLVEMVEAAVRSGDLTAGQQALRRLSERANAAGTPFALGQLARAQALMAGVNEAEPRYQESLAQLRLTLMVTDLARSHLVYGEWLRRNNRRADARRELTQARALFAEMGAELFEERARLELVAAGTQVPKRTERAEPNLTPKEAQIAALAAGGATNGEIATRLYITSSTVEYHLNKVFRKLGLTSRRQLRQVMPSGLDRPEYPE